VGLLQLLIIEAKDFFERPTTLIPPLTAIERQDALAVSSPCLAHAE
jgi:hypothetical protein